YLVSPGRLTKPDGTPYQVFTPYCRRWAEHGWRSPAHTGPRSARWIDPADVAKSLEIPDPGTELPFPAGEKAARRRWKRFAEHAVTDYDTDRDRPDLDNTSRMSAYLHFGNIHPRTMAADLDTRAAGPRAYLRELAFRDFYAAVLAQWPRSAWWNFNADFDAIEVDDGPDARRAFAAWQDGRTGFPIVDAGMRQLRQTGFMPNRVRMIAASFLVKDLHLPWQWGARWFLDQLVDGDLASNNHGWQWAAGSGTDAAPYFRVFNPQTQATKFDPNGVYVRRWIPELDSPDYPEPIVDHGRERAEALRRYQRIR
ncbi:MAG TPA: deoxyribodipyrimidine photo-lyase, partial [Mycobacterium sp.]|nr:deoxyribodipyrimidine photo-lyase [Mycobacterium sp.]